MEFTKFIRPPIVVEAVEITLENIGEIASKIGEIRHKPDGTPYIAIDRRVVPHMTKAYLGSYVTIADDNYHCYTAEAFARIFDSYQPIKTYMFEDTSDQLKVPVTDDKGRVVDMKTTGINEIDPALIVESDQFNESTSV